MAKTTGKNAIVTMDDSGGTARTVSADVASYSIEFTNNPEDVTGLGEGGQNFTPGLRVTKLTLEMYYNSAATTGSWTVVNGAIGSATSKTVTIQPEGTGLTLTGEGMYNMTGISGGADGTPLKFSVEVLPMGAVAWAWA